MVIKAEAQPRSAAQVAVNVWPGRTRPIPLYPQTTETLDVLRFPWESWDEFIWRVLLTPRGYVRILGEGSEGEHGERDGEPGPGD